MKKFRSRGIRIEKHNGNVIFSEKVYYEPDEKFLSDSFINRLIEKEKLQYFEYSENQYGDVDSLNFHNNLNMDELNNELYHNIENNGKDMIEKIVSVFDASFKNYTIGYRLKDRKIIGESYYFYPTVWKENRFGIKGITQKSKIIDYISKFVKEYIHLEDCCYEEIMEFQDMIEKFKGVSLTFFDYGNSFKIYARINQNAFYQFLRKAKYIDCIDKLNEYGELVLVAMRIKNRKISGYNVYFLE